MPNEKTTLLGGVSYNDEPDFDEDNVLIFDDKDLYRANLLYQYPVFVPVNTGLGMPVQTDSPVFISDSNYSNNNNSFNNTSNVKYVYVPPKNPEQRLDYINKKGNIKDFAYIPPIQEVIVMKPVKKEKNYDDILKHFYPDMPEKSQIQELKRIPLLTQNNEPQVKYYDDYPTLADKNYVVKPIDNTFTGGAASINDLSYQDLKDSVQTENDKTFFTVLDIVFGAEGKYSNNPNDKGGPTNMGITQSTYNDYCRRHNIQSKDVKELSKNEIIQIYYNDYWLKMELDKEEDPIKSLILFDTAVLHGVGRTKEFYKKSNGNLYKILDLRKNHYEDKIAKDKSQKQFEKGWNNRIDKLKQILDRYKEIKKDD